MEYNIKKSDAIEPEIITETGENISAPRQKRALAGGLRGGFLLLLRAAAGLLSGVLMFVLFAIFAVIIAVPVLILSLFGKKPNVKIFKFKM